MKQLVALAALALAVSPALAQTIPPPAISVNGEATISTVPDQAEIDAGVTSEAKTAREASDINNAAMGKVLLALKNAGIEEKDYQTSRLSLQPQYPSGQSRPGPAMISGYRATNRVTIKVRDITKIANLIDVLVGAGANEIGGIGFIVSQASKLLDDVREKAIADARRKAEIYAKASGVALGEALSISEGGPPPTPFFRGKMAAPMATAAPVAPGEETLSVTVNVSWAIKPKQ
ncbi:SIMPL domain-containing protein [Bradyrhizobium cenepequi]